MTVAVPEKKVETLMKEQKMEERKLILEGYKQARAGEVRDLDEVFDRLEKKYNDSKV